MKKPNLLTASILEDELKSKRISVEELVKFYLDRIEAYENNCRENRVLGKIM